MNKGLEEIRNPIGCEFSISRKKYVYSEEQVDAIEKELKEHEQHKAIEEELGINLFTFVKVLKAPEIYFKRENEILEIPHCDILWDIAVNSIAIVLEEDKNHTLYSIYYLRDYGKTWALTKEELE